jgi:hypothetical protein
MSRSGFPQIRVHRDSACIACHSSRDTVRCATGEEYRSSCDDSCMAHSSYCALRRQAARRSCSAASLRSRLSNPTHAEFACRRDATFKAIYKVALSYLRQFLNLAASPASDCSLSESSPVARRDVAPVQQISRNAHPARQTAAHPGIWRRIKIGLILTTATGLFASLPFALATGAHSIASFLEWEAIYAGVIALGAFLFARMVAHIVTAEFDTRQIEYGDYRVHETSMFDDDCWHRINPASGLPMNGSLDLAGNPFGWDSRIHGD